jgi:hypothetical protein
VCVSVAAGGRRCSAALATPLSPAVVTDGQGSAAKEDTGARCDQGKGGHWDNGDLSVTPTVNLALVFPLGDTAPPLGRTAGIARSNDGGAR